MRRIVRGWGLAAVLAALSAAPVLAQEATTTDTKGYISLLGGTVWSDGKSANLIFEGGGRVAPHLLAFGNLGRFNNLQRDLTPSLSAQTVELASDGIGVTAVGRLPAWYMLGGLRAEIPAARHAMPYVLGALGTARMRPNEQFMFESGALPDGSVPDAGTDVTSTLETSGALTSLAHSNSFMYTLGGGLGVPVTQHWAADLGYRYSHINADTALTADALGAKSMTFGFGYRF
jgi:opacity protein-like surface antigen